MEKNEKMWLIGAGIVLMTGFLLINTHNLDIACSDWYIDLEDRIANADARLTANPSEERMNEWLTLNRESYSLYSICAPVDVISD